MSEMRFCAHGWLLGHCPQCDTDTPEEEEIERLKAENKRLQAEDDRHVKAVEACYSVQRDMTATIDELNTALATSKQQSRELAHMIIGTVVGTAYNIHVRAKRFLETGELDIHRADKVCSCDMSKWPPKSECPIRSHNGYCTRCYGVVTKDAKMNDEECEHGHLEPCKQGEDYQELKTALNGVLEQKRYSDRMADAEHNQRVLAELKYDRLLRAVQDEIKNCDTFSKYEERCNDSIRYMLQKMLNSVK